MDDDGFERLRDFDAIYLGAIGDPVGARSHLGLAADPADPPAVRSVREPAADAAGAGRHDAAGGPRRRPTSTWSACARTPKGSTPASAGGCIEGTPDEIAQQVSVFTRRGIERIARYAFELAMQRPRRLLASATKSNALQYSMVLWDTVLDEVAKDYPSVSWRKYHVDALAARMVTDPAEHRRDRRVEPVRRHPHGSRRGGVRQPRHRAERQHQSRAAAIRRCSSRSTGRRPTSRARASRTRSAPSGPAR